MHKVIVLLTSLLSACVATQALADTTYMIRPPVMSLQAGVLAMPSNGPSPGNGNPVTGVDYQSSNWNSDLSARGSRYMTFTMIGSSSQSGVVGKTLRYAFPASIEACDWFSDPSYVGGLPISTGLNYQDNGVWSPKFKAGAPKAMSLKFKKAGEYRLVIECGSVMPSAGKQLNGSIEKVTFTIAP